MKKIRINELARELEVKPGVILDLLPELGVQEKKTHSSSIDEDVAIALRKRLDETGSRSSNGHSYAHAYDSDNSGEDGASGFESVEDEVDSEPTPVATAAPSAVAALPPQVAPVSPVVAPASSVIGPAHAVVAPAPEPQAVPSTPAMPAVEVAPAPAVPASPALPASAQASVEAERPAALKFQPLRPPMGGGGALHPPLAPPRSAHPGTPAQPKLGQPAPAITRGIGIPPRPSAPPIPRPGSTSTASSTSAGPRQPLPAEPPRSTPGMSSPLPSAPVERVARPIPGPQHPQPSRPPLSSPLIAGLPSAGLHKQAEQQAAPSAPAPSAPAASPGSPSAPSGPPVPPPSSVPLAPAARFAPPTHVVAPGPSQPAGGAPSAVPGSPIPPRPAPRPSSPSLTPGAPIAPRPQGARPLAGQPAARPIVPPRPDLVQRLKQQQQPTPRPGPSVPSMPRPGAPTARPTSPAPGQPLYRGPIRPGQPLMRGPGGPGGPGTPILPGQRRPGMRPMHPTSPLRAETATPMPPEGQRRHQAKPGARQGPRKREDLEEGILRERVSKRQAIAEPPPIDREITVAEGVTVKELSEKLGVKANLVIKKLVERKIFATINQTLDVKLAEELAREFGASSNKVSYEEESTQELEPTEENLEMVRRAPVVTIMGHVDHGKTSLLDALRQTNVAGREAGGITQHIGAYYIEKNGRKIVFIDTPGHQAFTRMRARGAKVTDIVVLVVSADDGVMPQTLEAIDHARAAGVPIIVAINKIDKPDSQPDRVKQQLADRGLLAEDWGGDVVMVPVSAKKGQNLDLLLEMILLVADLQDLKAAPGRPALGTVLEAKLDKGRGPVATMLVRNGTLRVGDFFICGSLFSKVRAMFDDRGNQVKEAEPSMPVEVIGLDALPEVGDNFQVVSDTSKAKQIVIYREAKARDAAMAKGARVATLDSLARQFKEGDLKDLNLIIKADVGGTAEVLSDTLQQLSNEKIRVRVLHSGVGAITESDVLLASASEALIIGFNVRPERSAQATAEQQKVEIRMHSIIYELIDEVKAAMTGLLEPVFKETVQGHAEVRETFKISKVGVVAGCYVSDGVVRRDSQIRLKRGGDVLWTGKIEALKRFKNDASEVKNGVECGISLANMNNVQQGDVLEAFTMERVAAEMPQPVRA